MLRRPELDIRSATTLLAGSDIGHAQTNIRQCTIQLRLASIGSGNVRRIMLKRATRLGALCGAYPYARSSSLSRPSRNQTTPSRRLLRAELCHHEPKLFPPCPPLKRTIPHIPQESRVSVPLLCQTSSSTFCQRNLQNVGSKDPLKEVRLCQHCPERDNPRSGPY